MSARSSTTEGDVEMNGMKKQLGNNGDVENRGDLMYKNKTGSRDDGWQMQTDAVFGQVSGEGPNYKAVSYLAPAHTLI